MILTLNTKAREWKASGPVSIDSRDISSVEEVVGFGGKYTRIILKNGSDFEIKDSYGSIIESLRLNGWGEE